MLKSKSERRARKAQYKRTAAEMVAAAMATSDSDDPDLSSSLHPHSRAQSRAQPQTSKIDQSELDKASRNVKNQLAKAGGKKARGGGVGSMETVEGGGSGAGGGGGGGGGRSRVVYLGHIPHGFYEDQMRGFFGQFGEVTRLRLSRSRKTGRSRHYAFIEFAGADVAEVVAETMNKYVLMGSYLVCHVVPKGKQHDDMFIGANRTFRPIPWRSLAKAEMNKPKTDERVEARAKKLLLAEERKRAKLAELGYDYDFGGYRAALEESVAGADEASDKRRKRARKDGTTTSTDSKASKASKKQSNGASEAAPMDVDSKPKKSSKASSKSAKSAPMEVDEAPKSKAAKTPRAAPAKAAKTPKAAPAKAAKTPKAAPAKAAKTPKAAPAKAAKTPKAAATPKPKASKTPKAATKASKTPTAATTRASKTPKTVAKTPNPKAAKTPKTKKKAAK